VALAALRSERGSGARPAEIIARVNGALKDATDADSFTTLVYATLDRATGQISYLNMGHPAPFLLRAPGDDDTDDVGLYVEGHRNRAAGWFDEPGYEETPVRLHPGDRLVLYTDGFLEAKSPDGEVFGEHRLATALTRLAGLDADQIAEELVREVESFAAGKLDDDLTMLVVVYEGPRREQK
jgi:serine phosphatase RsbU (regulator of sigma subunit)